MANHLLQLIPLSMFFPTSYNLLIYLVYQLSYAFSNLSTFLGDKYAGKSLVYSAESVQRADLKGHAEVFYQLSLHCIQLKMFKVVS